MKRNEISAIILAGGMSTRMDEFKPLAELGGKPLILRTIDTFKATGVKDIIVVVGCSAELLKPVLASAGVRMVKNPHFKLGMFSSVQIGVDALDETTGAFFILPVDVPLVRPATVRRLIEAYRGGDPKVVYPVFEDRRGHPPLLDSACAKDILREGPLSTLRAVLDVHEPAAVDIACPDEAILLDLDTPEDRRSLSARLPLRGVPSPAECLAMLRVYGASDAVARHGQAVAALARRIAESLSRKRLAAIDIDLLVAACILHDIAKGIPSHPMVGAAIMRKEGFPAIADCIACHMDISLPPGRSWPLTEKEILFLADKLVEEDRIVSLEKRFAKSELKAGGEKRIVSKVRERRNAARALMARVESCLNAAEFEAAPWFAQV